MEIIAIVALAVVAIALAAATYVYRTQARNLSAKYVVTQAALDKVHEDLELLREGGYYIPREVIVDAAEVVSYLGEIREIQKNLWDTGKAFATANPTSFTITTTPAGEVN